MNRKVLVTETHLEAIAEAIRAKSGTTATYTLPNMASAIRAISTMTAYVNGTTLIIGGRSVNVTGTTVEVNTNG